MSYETAPATQMIATNCAACGRPLVDSASVTAGIGPECRKRYGVSSIPNDIREQANKVVYAAAVAVSQNDAMKLGECVTSIRALGLDKLAAIIAERFYGVRIEEQGDSLVVFTAYNEQAVWGFRSIPGQRWDRSVKANVVPKTAKAALWTVLKAHFAGSVGIGPKGSFEIK